MIGESETDKVVSLRPPVTFPVLLSSPGTKHPDKIGDDALPHGMRLVMLVAVLACLRCSPPLHAHGMINLYDRLDCPFRQLHFFG